MENLVDESASTEHWGSPEQECQDTSKSSHELPTESRAKVESDSGKHNVHTHFPKDPIFDICLKTKITRACCRRRVGTVVPRAEHFGELITADLKVFVKNVNRGTMVQNLAAQWIQSHPCKTKTCQETRRTSWSSWIRRRNQKSFTLTIPPWGNPEQESQNTSQHFSWTSNGAASKRGIGFGQEQCTYALSERPKLWYLLEDGNNKVFCRRRAGTVVPKAKNFWWFDYSRWQSS